MGGQTVIRQIKGYIICLKKLFIGKVDQFSASQTWYCYVHGTPDREHLSTRIITDPKFVEVHLKYFLNTCWCGCTFTKKPSIDIINWLETDLSSLHWSIWK